MTHQSCSTTLSGISLVRSYVFQIQMNYPVSRKSKYRLYAEAYLDQYILTVVVTEYFKEVPPLSEAQFLDLNNH